MHNVALFGQNVHDEINKKKISSEPQPQAEWNKNTL